MNDQQRHAYGCAETVLSLALDLIADAERYLAEAGDEAQAGEVWRLRKQLTDVYTTCDQRRKPAEVQP